ncbi:M15 family metallopeptidase [Pseudobacillus badius]|uniref:M15 family metallopeptidase n=1 Tax=Bacillus badius TaxID=1455 RepID=UPI0007B38B66|nr:M15 family metallopeptidase [Bacillus badius]KZR58989.1 hypothetical protein A3781_00325 [Bacillus badius]
MGKLPINEYLVEAFKRNKCKQVHQNVYKLAEELVRRCWKEDVFIVFTDGLRTFEDQAAIYGKGRSSYIYKGKQYGNPKVKKVSNAEPGTSFHNYGLALDFVTCDGYGKNIDWNVGPKWRRAAVIAKELGFTWGGDWTSFKDYPHIQYDGGLSIGQVQNGAFPKFKLTESLSTPKPAPASKPSHIGIVEVLVGNLNVRAEASFNSKIVKVVTKGSKWKCYGKKNGLYNLGKGAWVSAGSKYTKFTPV